MTVPAKSRASKLSQKDLKTLVYGRGKAVSKSKPQKPKTPKAVPEITLSPGDVVSGEVSGAGDHGVFVKIGDSLFVGRIKLSDLSTRFITGADAKKLMPVGSQVSDLVVSSVDKAANRIDLKPKSRQGEPEVGSLHKAIVKKVEKFGVIMSFPNSLLRCLCVTEDVDDDLDNCKAVLAKIQPGHKYTVKVIRVEQGKIWVSMKQSVVGTSEVASYDQPVMELAIEPTDPVDEPELIEDSAGSAVVPTWTPKRPVADALEEEDALEESVTARKKNKRQRESAKQEKEAQIREKEAALLSGEWRNNPETCDEFERLILEDKSAAVWIKYMSYWLKMAEVAKARDTVERGLKQSTMSEEDKFNLWIAYMNMEAAFGSGADQVFARAAQYCDPKRVHHALPQVYARAGQTDKAITAFERMCAKLPACRKAWMNYVEFLFNTDRMEEARSIFTKGLKALPKHKHVRATTKLGQLEFRNGNSERGTSVFEQLLQAGSNMARTDIWSILFDEVIKANTPPSAETADLSTIRTIFEKALSANLKPKKMKSFFKRWLDFEMKFGSDADIESVKKRAVEYVESIGNNE
jgi:rRNA biogenesis protein RRP5